MIAIVVAIIFYSIAVLLGAFASRNADTNIVSAIINSVAAVIPVGYVGVEYSKRGTPMATSRQGLIAALLAGVAIAIFSIAINKSYAVNKVAIVAPLIFGGSIFITSILSYFLFKERISPIQATGLILLGAGLGLIIYAKASGR